MFGIENRMCTIFSKGALKGTPLRCGLWGKCLRRILIVLIYLKHEKVHTLLICNAKSLLQYMLSLELIQFLYKNTQKDPVLYSLFGKAC